MLARISSATCATGTAWGSSLTGSIFVVIACSSPTVERDYRIGRQLTPALPGVAGFELNLDATRREAAGGDAAPEHGAMLRAITRWSGRGAPQGVGQRCPMLRTFPH